jgi:hypothetical protein
MQINYNRELRGAPRADQLGLTSHRFREEHMGSHAKE